jgi:hypothetical protein
MRQTRLEQLRTDPLPALLAWDDRALAYFVRRDLLEQDVPPSDSLWSLPEPVLLCRRQLPDGSWEYAGKGIDPDTGQNYFLLETFRNLRILVEKYGFTREHAAIQNAASYLFSCQTPQGDLRGLLGNQYMPYYMGEILALLIYAGYGDDRRTRRALDWLLSVRQDDGGWLVPVQIVPSSQRTNAFWKGPPVEPDRALPHAHMATGMVLRAFAAPTGYRTRPEVGRAAEALKSRLFQPDKHNSRKGREYWFKFQFPFWWSNLLTALDSLAKLGFSGDDPVIARGLRWFAENQEPDGLWPTGYGSGRKAEANRRWVGLAVCRMLRSYYL